MDLTLCDWCLHKKGKFRQRQTCAQGGDGDDAVRRWPQAGPILCGPSLRTSSLQNREAVNVCCLNRLFVVLRYSNSILRAITLPSTYTQISPFSCFGCLRGIFNPRAAVQPSKTESEREGVTFPP